MLRAVVLTQYRRVTDRRTDGIGIASTVLVCEKFHQVDTKTILIPLTQPKTTYCSSTFRLHVGSLHQD